jgi:hypothetical protein
MICLVSLTIAVFFTLCIAVFFSLTCAKAQLNVFQMNYWSEYTDVFMYSAAKGGVYV